MSVRLLRCEGRELFVRRLSLELRRLPDRDMALRPDRRSHDLRPIFVARRTYRSTCIPGFEAEELQHLGGLAALVELHIVGRTRISVCDRRGNAGGLGVHSRKRTIEPAIASDSASILKFRIAFPLLVATARLPSLEDRPTTQIRSTRNLARLGGFALGSIFPSAIFFGGSVMATVASSTVNIQNARAPILLPDGLFLVALVFIGFAPSFYLRGIVPEYPRPNPTLPPSVVFHGLMFTLWMLVFVAQTQLVAAGRRDIHMKLGAASMFLAIAMIPVMYLTGVWQVARNNVPPFTNPLDWTSLPLFAMPGVRLPGLAGLEASPRGAMAQAADAWRRDGDRAWAVVRAAAPGSAVESRLRDTNDRDSAVLRAPVHLGQAHHRQDASSNEDRVRRLRALHAHPGGVDREWGLGANRAQLPGVGG